MTLWIILMASLFVCTALGTIYLIRRFSRFSFVSKPSGDKKSISYLISAAMLAVAFAVIFAFMGAMNTIICLLHLALVWLLCDLAAFLLRKLRKKDFRRYYAGAIAMVFTVLWLSAGWYTAHNVIETDYTINTDKSVGALRVVMLADSHLGATFDGDGFARHMERIQAAEPDIVLVVGDFVDENSYKADMQTACEALGKLKTKYGVYYVFGNHDKGRYGSSRDFSTDDLKAALTANNVTILEDDVLLIDNRFYLIGRQDASDQSDFGGTRASMSELTKDLDDNIFSIVMDHQPRDYAAQAKSGVDLVVSGHTHGGQLIPLTTLMKLTGIGGNDRVYGAETRENTDFIVTSGISDWEIFFKTGCVSEFTVIDIKGK